MDTNYFVCTLGQAAALMPDGPSFRNVNEFVDLQAHVVPSKPAVGFFRPPKRPAEPWSTHVYSFFAVQKASLIATHKILHHAGNRLSERQTVALLCPSSPDFLFTWLALMRLGHEVLLIAPQCHPAAIVHLCKTCRVSFLFYDDIYQDQVHKSVQELAADSPPFTTVSLTDCLGEDNFKADDNTEISKEGLPEPQVEENSVAYLHHTSGTSSGLPKPIPQTHRAAVCVLPRLENGSGKATFTTTPLYHGGIADLFRSWTSNALIWLFPAKELPITAGNITRCLETVNLSSESGETPPVAFFSSVPYVLQMMEADETGLQYLRNMELVGVGGAALPKEVGDRLVEKGINLVSRYGSAECGFLMPSHRHYSKDNEWQYLRSTSGAENLKFEAQGDGTFELVILPGWPHMAKKNRDDGSFATADLFVPHPDISNAWKYHSRADSQLTLITGKKFDPAPLEASITTSPCLDDALIFGNGKPFPGVLMFRGKESAEISDEDLVDFIQPHIERLNEESQDHAKIPRNMLVPMPYCTSGLEKSSKGTVMRGKAEEKFSNVIEDAYSKLSLACGPEISDDEMKEHITSMVEILSPKPGKLGEDTDLFNFGIDSVACMQIRHGLAQLLPANSPELPLSIVEDCGTVSRLTDFVIKARSGDCFIDDEDEYKLMQDFVTKYSMFDGNTLSAPAKDGATYLEQAGEVVVLTGATGALGAHILDQYRNSDQVKKIYCLVRGIDGCAARERVNKALSQKGFSDLSSDNIRNDKIIVFQSRLSESSLGLSQETYEKIASEATIIMHVAWSVNFRMRLRSFENENIKGVHNLINLALSSPKKLPPRFAYCSSVASAIEDPTSPVPERIMDSPGSASPLGYSRSKWVAESICYNAHQNTRLRSRVTILRVGQLSGDSYKGIWNTQEAWPMMLGTVKLTGCLPALPNEPLNWLPVDVAAQAFVQAMTGISAKKDSSGPQSGDSAMRVFHVLNKHATPDWMQLLAWLMKMETFEIVDPREWLERLEKLQADGREHPAMKLLGLWRKAYGDDTTHQSQDLPGAASEKKQPVFATEKTEKAAPVLKNIEPVDEKYFGKIWAWLRDV